MEIDTSRRKPRAARKGAVFRYHLGMNFEIPDDMLRRLIDARSELRRAQALPVELVRAGAPDAQVRQAELRSQAALMAVQGSRREIMDLVEYLLSVA